jgi:DNA-binding transcriptional LysR family regulator
MLIRQLEYLVALATERHFARAAERSGVSQPTLSAALRQLEGDLGTAIVERGNRFRGFTADGEIVLRWARRMLADEASLKQELDAARGMLKGRLRVGVIPSTNAVVPHLTASFASEHAAVSIDETETTSIEILRKLAAYELDVGITYVDNEPLEHVRTLAIYDEQYVALIPERSALAGLDTVTWEQLATIPLCLMHRDMQNRRIYDAAFASVGCSADVRIEVYSMMAELAYLQAGYLGTIMPSTLLPWLRVPGMRVAPIVQPNLSNAVGLVIADRSPVPALIETFWQHVERSIPMLSHVLRAARSTAAIAP